MRAAARRVRGEGEAMWSAAELPRSATSVRAGHADLGARTAKATAATQVGAARSRWSRALGIGTVVTYLHALLQCALLNFMNYQLPRALYDYRFFSGYVTFFFFLFFLCDERM